MSPLRVRLTTHMSDTRFDPSFQRAVLEPVWPPPAYNSCCHIKQTLLREGYEPIGDTPAQFKAQVARYAKLIRTAGIQAN